MQNIRSIFLIDDDNMTNLINNTVLRRLGFVGNIQIFNEPVRALDYLKELAINDELPDLIFLDINMPEMNGWEFLEDFEKLPNAIQPKCKVIILSSSIHPPDIEKSHTYTIVHKYIPKPLAVNKLQFLKGH